MQKIRLSQSCMYTFAALFSGVLASTGTRSCWWTNSRVVRLPSARPGCSQHSCRRAQVLTLSCVLRVSNRKILKHRPSSHNLCRRRCCFRVSWSLSSPPARAAPPLCRGPGSPPSSPSSPFSSSSISSLHDKGLEQHSSPLAASSS